MEYKILEKGTIKKLEKEVQVWIESGWLPQGGISFYTEEAENSWGKFNAITFIQAMTKQ